MPGLAAISKWAYAQSAALRGCVTGSCCKAGVHVKIVLSFATKNHCMKPLCTLFCTCVCKFAYRFFHEILMNFRSPRHPEAPLKPSRGLLGTQDGLRGLPGTNFHRFWGSFWDPWGSPGSPCGRPGALPGHFFRIFDVTFSTFSRRSLFYTVFDPKVIEKSVFFDCVDVAFVY